MKTYITREQFEALHALLGDTASEQLAQINIAVSDAPTADQIAGYDLSSMATEIGRHIALVFTDEEVKHEYPWLSDVEAKDIASICAEHFDYDFRGEVVHGAMEANGHPTDAPEGWFEWLNADGDLTHATWTEEDNGSARIFGWEVSQPGEDGQVRILAVAGSIQEDEAMQAYVMGLAEAWWKGLSKGSEEARLASLAIGYIECLAETKRYAEEAKERRAELTKANEAERIQDERLMDRRVIDN